jgi:hypothetical protein
MFVVLSNAIISVEYFLKETRGSVLDSAVNIYFCFLLAESKALLLFSGLYSLLIQEYSKPHALQRYLRQIFTYKS